MGRRITIVGGGLAGLSLGILLRRAEVPVEVYEAGMYPRHRVCGEFISGRGGGLLGEMGLKKELDELGCQGRTVRFFNGGANSRQMRLPENALCVSRAKLDHFLAAELQRRGGVLHTGSRWNDGFDQPGVVRATGRKPARNDSRQRRFLGLKIHARRLELSADLELHFGPFGYVGFSKLPDGAVNICGLFIRRPALHDLRRDCRRVFQSVVRGSMRDALDRVELDAESYSAVAGLSLGRERAGSTAECRIGDSICMIPPLTGNGMSLAIESASLAAPILSRYSRGELNWAQSQERISQLCDLRFGPRLKTAAILQRLTGFGLARYAMLLSLTTAPALLDWGFSATR